MSIIIVFHILIDYIFGFGVMKETLFKSGVSSYKNGKFVKYHNDLREVFELSRKIFNVGTVKLFIKESAQPNAFALGSMRANAIVITTGLLNLIYSRSSSKQNTINALKGVIGHEMSHLINKDFLPGSIIRITSVSTKRSSQVIVFIFQVFFYFLNKIPVLGYPFAKLSSVTYKTIRFISFMFFTYIILPFHQFVDIFLSKAMELRADADSAKAFGSKCMATVLHYLGENSYHNIFYHHPSIKNRLVFLGSKKFKQVKTFVPNPITNFVNIATVLILFVAPYKLAQLIEIHNIFANITLIVKGLSYNIKYTIIMLIDIKDVILSVF